ncbi:hypothetical protein [Nonomuraea sp. NPDC052265]|uniref:hypothetical protein n=1 Tax=Nonomuraea sp. NPDC052265 TaxID=3364374 RepID=UPI0037CB2A78
MLDADAVGGAVQRMEQGRSSGMAYLAQRLADQGVLRPDVTADQAADLLWLLTSFDSFDLLYTGRTPSVDEVAKTLITTAERSLCRQGAWPWRPGNLGLSRERLRKTEALPSAFPVTQNSYYLSHCLPCREDAQPAIGRTGADSATLCVTSAREAPGRR